MPKRTQHSIKDTSDRRPSLRVVTVPEHTTPRRKRNISERVNVHCGCCGEVLTIVPPDDGEIVQIIEIGGVSGTVKQWQEVFGPLLGLTASKPTNTPDR